MPEGDKGDGRPNRTTMEGMIWNANHVLEAALKPNIAGLPKWLFRESVGIVLMSTVQVGCILSGTVGTGIAMHRVAEKEWSAPCAVGVSSLSFGILLGASTQDLVMFVPDEETMRSLSTKHGCKIASQLELTVALGRATKSDMNFSKKGVGTTFTLAYSKGAFAGLSIEGAVIGARESVNNKFYGDNTDAADILGGKVQVPDDKVTMLKELYEKLSKLEEGATAEPTAAEEKKKEEAKEAAEKEGEAIKDSDEVVEVDAAAEAAKETKA